MTHSAWMHYAKRYSGLAVWIDGGLVIDDKPARVAVRDCTVSDALHKPISRVQRAELFAVGWRRQRAGVRNSVHEGTISNAASDPLFDVTADSYSMRSWLGLRCIKVQLHTHYPSQLHEIDALDSSLVGCGDSEPA